jgi:hypothetical protein
MGAPTVTNHGSGSKTPSRRLAIASKIGSQVGTSTGRGPKGGPPALAMAKKAPGKPVANIQTKPANLSATKRSNTSAPKGRSGGRVIVAPAGAGNVTAKSGPSAMARAAGSKGAGRPALAFSGAKSGGIGNIGRRAAPSYSAGPQRGAGYRAPTAAAKSAKASTGRKR